MKRIGQIFLWGSLALVALWVVPSVVNLMTLEGYSTPFTLYSCTVHDFTALDRGEGSDFRFIDTKGNVYGDEAQPMFYASLLASKGALPDSIEGRKISLEEIEKNKVIVSVRPKDVNKTSAPVYLLMESVPERLELQDPEDALVSRKDGIYVYNMEENVLLEEKTARLRKALDSLGFAYPAKLFAGNPSHHKAYDEGYLVTDARSRVFQLKQVNGTVQVRAFPQADNLGVKYLTITEFENHATLGYLVDADSRLHMLVPDGRVLPTGVTYVPEKEDLLVVGDLFYYTVKTSDDKGEHFWALRSSDFSPVASYERAYPSGRSLPGLRFTSSLDNWVKPRFK